MSLFEIKRRSSKPRRNMITPNAASTRGVAFQESATAGTAELADGSVPYGGFLVRDVLVGGPVLGDSVYPGRLGLPNTATQEAAFEFGEEVEAESTLYLDAAITTGTALKSLLSFVAGKFKVAVTGQFAEFMLVEQQTPEVVGNVRIRVIAISCHRVP